MTVAGTTSVDDTSTPAGPVCQALTAGQVSTPVDFVMTNPPFYDVGEKVRAAAVYWLIDLRVPLLVLALIA